MKEKAIEEVAKLVAIKNSTLNLIKTVLEQEDNLSKNQILRILKDFEIKIKMQEDDKRFDN